MVVVLVTVFAQILRNWLLHAVGVDASLFDATAVLIAVVTLGQLPVGPSVGAAAAVLILGSRGVAAEARHAPGLTRAGRRGHVRALEQRPSGVTTSARAAARVIIVDGPRDLVRDLSEWGGVTPFAQCGPRRWL